nr:hypothetical protein [Blastococcus saxobsidens]
MRETHGYAKQGAGYGYNKVKGLNALLATISIPIAAPAIGAAKLRKGAVKSARGAGKLLGEALGTARACGAGGPDRSGLVLVRADSAFYCHDVIAAASRGGARFWITARMGAAVRKAIAAIDESALRAAVAAAPAPRPAVGTRLDPAVRRHARPTGSGLTRPPPYRARPETDRGRAGQSGG